jgi:broad specificity phosphatase PhoE
VSETTLLLIRHAESTWNAAGRWQGQGDPPLSDRGRRQAEDLSRDLAGEPIDLLVSSDLARAVETARIVGATRGLRPTLNAKMRELSIGDWTGLTRDQIETRAADVLRDFERGESDVRPGGGESRREIRLRVRSAIAELVAANPGRRLAVVTHLGAIRALLPGTELENAGWRSVARLDLLPDGTADPTGSVGPA